MARQKTEDSLVYLVFRLMPAWAVAATVVACYVLLRWLVPFFLHGTLWAQISATYAPLFTVVLALFAAVAEADKYKRRRLLGQQRSLETLRNMTWLEFEHLVGEVYRQQGYKVEEKGGSGPDGGIDIVLRRGRETVLVQCKQWKTQSVGVRPLRELRGLVASQAASHGVFVTCGGYTSAALSEFEHEPIELVDGLRLLKLVQQVQAKGTARQAELSSASAAAPILSVGQIVNEAAEPACPKCGAAMKQKTACQGANAGNEFWGCSQYPRCRGTRQME